jgi:hypothetical protein
MPRGKSGKAILPTVDEVQSKEKSKVEEAIEKVKRKKVVKEESDDEEEVVKEVVKEAIEPEKKVQPPQPIEQPPAPTPTPAPVEKPKRVYARKPKAEPKPRIYEEEEDDDEPEFIIQRARPIPRQEQPQFDPSIFTKQFEETQTKIQKFNEQLEELKKQNQRQRLFDYRDGLTVLKNHSHQMKIKF